MKNEIKEIIRETAQQTAREVVLNRIASGKNYYKIMESLLRSYPLLKQMVDNPEEYGFIPPEKSKSITVAPPKGSGFRSHEDILIDTIESRKNAFEYTLSHFVQIDSVVKLFRNDPGFDVVRMYYFMEDYEGNPIEHGASNTFEDIFDDLSNHGVMTSIKTMRMQRTKIVRQMAIVMFGIDGAVSVSESSMQNEQQK